MSSLYESCQLSSRDSHPQIRGLTILKGGIQARVRCKLDVYSFDDVSTRPQYKAISYSWGSTANKIASYINGHRILVTESAYESLRCLRKEDEDVMVWIDAICIDQDNEDEKNNQVAMMGDIYGHAQEISVWLGQEDESTSIAFEFLRTLHSKWDNHEWLVKSYHDKSFDIKWKSLDQLILRVPYWKRVWIMQEVSINAANRIVYKGKQTLPWRMFLGLNNLYFGSHTPPAATYADRLVRDLPVPITMQRIDLKYSGCRQFLHLLAMARYQSCQRAHDRIYGILNIFPEDHGFRVPIRYDLPAEEVYHDAAVKLIAHTKKLDLLALSESSNTPMELPSWCPDWHTPRRQTNIFMVYGIRQPDASRNIDAFYEFDETRRMLTVDAIFVDRIGTLHRPYAPPPGRADADFIGDKLEDVQGFIDSWANELCQGVDDEAERIRRRSALLSTVLRQNGESDEPCRAGSEDESIRQLHALENLHEAFLSIQNRRLFTSEKRDLMGLAPDNAQVGDHIVVVKGCRIPLILRQASGGYIDAGESFVRGIMFGEALDLDLEFERATIV